MFSEADEAIASHNRGTDMAMVYIRILSDS
jgi:hypothetical protein